MFGLDFVLIAGLDMLGRLISIPGIALGLIEKIRANLVAAAAALWLLLRKLSDESRAITLTVRLERHSLKEEDSSTQSDGPSAFPSPKQAEAPAPPS